MRGKRGKWLFGERLGFYKGVVVWDVDISHSGYSKTAHTLEHHEMETTSNKRESSVIIYYANAYNMCVIFTIV